MVNAGVVAVVETNPQKRRSILEVKDGCLLCVLPVKVHYASWSYRNGSVVVAGTKERQWVGWWWWVVQQRSMPPLCITFYAFVYCVYIHTVVFRSQFQHLTYSISSKSASKCDSVALSTSK
jgi:hypothetical protein